MKTRYWLSFHQPTDDHRPLTDPPHPQVLGWWCSGYDPEDVAVICALVEAESEEDAKTFIGISWPEAERWRFCEQLKPDHVLSDRFPLKPWMIERMCS